MRRSSLPRRKKALRSNAEQQREWERRTRENQIARQKERGDRPGKLPRVERPPTPRTSAVTNRHGSYPAALEQMKKEVKERAGGLCEANWPGVCPDGPHRGNQTHHVILRSQGGPDAAWNGLYVCAVVHTHAHDVDRAGAEERGIIRRWRAV